MYWFKLRRSREEGATALSEAPTASISQRSETSERIGRDDRLPQFRGSARDQLTELSLSKFDRMRINFRNAFTPAQPVCRRARFAGRREALSRLIHGIEDQRLHAIVYGDRGIGKTSLLHVMAESAREAGYLVLYESCDAGTGFDDLFRSVLRQIPQLYHGGITPSDDTVEAGGTLLDLATQGSLTPRLVTDLLAAVAGVRVILMLDEFDRATSSEFRGGIAELIKNLSDRCARVQLMVAGVASNFAELVDHVPSIRRNILSLELPRMDDAEIEELIAIGAKESGLRFSEAASLRIRSMAHGYPYIAILLAHHSGMAAIDLRAEEVSLMHVAAAVQELEAYISPGPPAGDRLAVAGLRPIGDCL